MVELIAEVGSVHDGSFGNALRLVDLAADVGADTVKFQTQQVNVTKNAAGEVVDGDSGNIASVVDIWTFARNTRSRDPNWVLVATTEQQ